MFKPILALLLLPLFLTGCTTFNLTNLTASSQPRADDNLYRVELEISSNQHALRWDSISPIVTIGPLWYPMELTPLMTNRWETLIPIPANENVVHYIFKVNYDYNQFGGVGNNSVTSTEYTLTVRD